MNTWTLKIGGDIDIVVPADLSCLSTYVLLEQEDWFEDEMQLVRQYIQPGMNCIDAGACFGVYARSFAKLSGPNGRVLAFEPGELAAKCLGVERPQNLKVFRIGLSSTASRGGLSGSVPELLSTSRGSSIELATLDQQWLDSGKMPISLLKVDVHGHELEVLKGAKELLSECSPLIICAKDKTGVCGEYLQSLGYQLYRYNRQTGALVPLIKSHENDFMLNFVAAKPDAHGIADLLSTVAGRTDLNTTAYLSGLPWTKDLIATWQSAQDTPAANADYFEAFQYICSGNTSAAIKILEALVSDNNAPAAVGLSLIRALLMDGQRTRAVELLKQAAGAILAGKSITLDLPFLPPLPDQDHIPIGSGTVQDWIQARCIEALLSSQSFSSYIAPVNELQYCKNLTKNPERSLAADRRIVLCLQRIGKNVRIGSDSRLLSSVALNAEVWKNLADVLSTASRLNNEDFVPNGTSLTTRGFLIADRFLFTKLNASAYNNAVSIFGTSFCGKAVIKIEVFPNSLKECTLDKEAEIVKHLHLRECNTSPKFLGDGKISASIIKQLAPFDVLAGVSINQLTDCSFYLQEYLKSDGGYSFADIALALIEQKALGVYHGDIRPDNIRFDKKQGIIKLIDYDQAQFISEDVRAMDNRDFFNWCIKWAKKKYEPWRHSHFLAYFGNIDFDKVFWPLFKEDALNLADTSVFKNQITTAAKAGIYHTIENPHCFIKGERSLGDRKAMLDKISFAENERVLDVGCSSGILSMYLAERGCVVTGVEIDEKLLHGNRIIANITGQKIRYIAMDLDQSELPGKFDTICLFSVIHHTKKLHENCIKIAENCSRILIECRLKEYGLKWMGSGFEKSSAWDYVNFDEMIIGLESLFPGFSFNRNYGQGDRDRYLLEFIKRGSPFL